MPKKSRERKIKASERLYQSLLQQKTIKNTLREKTAAAIQKSYFNNPPPQQNENERQLTAYFKADFNKSLLLIGSVIALEIFFYFASMSSNFARLFNF